MPELEAAVLVVGAGPVGLTLASSLAQRGVEVLVVEQRAPGTAPQPKCNHVSARSMEIFRRLDLARSLREIGLPDEYPNDVSYRLTATGPELARIPIPSRAERFSATGGPDTWWPTPEPPHRVNQIYIEPLLQRHAEGQPSLRLLPSTRLVEFEQSEDEVIAVVEDLAGGEERTVRCGYLVGCDGGRSTVRKRIGSRLSGEAMLQRVQSSFIRAPQLLGLMPEPAWATFSFNPRRSGNTYAIDGRELWTVHNYLRAEETDFEAVDRDACLRTILGVDADFDYELLSKEDWIGRRLVADRLRDRRVFICGDAAHIWVPMAGYGMNAGIADAENLAWQLGAVLEGWGGAGLLDGYEAERLPVTEQVSHYAMGHARALAEEIRAVPPAIEAEGPGGEELRSTVGSRLYELNVQQYCCGGLNFGYFYDRSPLISYDGEDPPAYTLYDFEQSTVPGCRTPHVWLADGRSLYDAVGSGFTLLRGEGSAPDQSLARAAAERSLPLRQVELSGAEAGEIYGDGLVLSRPDQHIAWRGEEPPADPGALLDAVRGAAP